MTDFGAPKIERIGERAVTLAYAGDASLALQERIWSLAAQASRHPAVAEAVPGMGNLTLFLRDADDDAQPVLDELARWSAQTHQLAPRRGRPVEIPVRYGGADGPDLAAVAAHCGLREDEVVRIHAQAEYVVYFLGFQPGFAYLGGLDPRIATPRLATPRTRVPSGSVGIGGTQTGIYPRSGPGGWQLIGRTDTALFDWRAEPPALLRAGDRVRFVALDA